MLCVQESVPVTIVDDDDGGMLMFELPTKEVRGWWWCNKVLVLRRNGEKRTHIEGIVLVPPSLCIIAQFYTHAFFLTLSLLLPRVSSPSMCTLLCVCVGGCGAELRGAARRASQRQ